MTSMFQQHDEEFPDQPVIFRKVHDQTARIALVIISTAGFGLKMGWKDSVHKDQAQAAKAEDKMSLNTALHIMTTGHNLLLRIALPKLAYLLPFKGLQTIDRSFKQFEVSMKDLINERLALQQKGEQRDDLFDAVVGSMLQPEGFTMSETLGCVSIFTQSRCQD